MVMVMVMMMIMMLTAVVPMVRVMSSSKSLFEDFLERRSSCSPVASPPVFKPIRAIRQAAYGIGT